MPYNSEKAQSKISETDALAIAKRLCEQKDWPWLEPIKIKLKQGQWLIHTNYGNRGANCHLVVDANTGSIIKKAYFPR